MTPEEKQAIIDENEAALEKLKIEIAERKRDREMYGDDVPLYEERVKKSAPEVHYRTQRDARPKAGDGDDAWNEWWKASYRAHIRHTMDAVMEFLGKEAGVMERELRQYIDEQIGALRVDLKVEKAAEKQK